MPCNLFSGRELWTKIHILQHRVCLRVAAIFNAWIEVYLCPRLSASDVVVLDNAKNKTRQTRELIEASGAEVLFLPPYSPDYNPIEHDFAISNVSVNTYRWL